MAWLSTLVLALAVSLDSLSVGFTYGVKKMRVPGFSLMLMSLISAFGMLVSMMVGQSLCSILGNQCHIIGSAILILMGFFSLGTTCLPRTKQKGFTSISTASPSTASPLKMVARVVEEPVEADLDDSGEISIIEALLLGAALALDSLGTGFGAALADYQLVITSGLVGLLTLATLSIGLRAGQMVELPSNSLWAKLAPGVLLVLLGTSKLI
ncbi:MAG: sporulation membrane protein YtaF [Firmicutes bacterium]|nr:sporulation membrane protein YtaF [Bacillota bacterium]